MKITIHSFRFILTFIVLCNVFSLITYKSYGQFDFGKSYINVTKGLNGGTVEPGDILEIRASIVVRRTSAGANTVIDNVAYYDAIPTGTIYIPGTIRVLTNEGKIYKQFTDAAGDDPGWLAGTNIRINLGYTVGDAHATAAAPGRIRNTHRPSFYSNTCIMIASFRVTVNTSVGGLINTGGGRVDYRSGLTNISFPFSNNTVAVYTNYGICANTVGVNSLGTESNGTFGTGTNKDRAASANVPAGYTYAPFSGNMPNDYYYGVSNNTSTGGAGFSTSNAWNKPDGSSTSHRVFSVWDIIGDHTGAASPTAGNPATANGANGGYMLVVNAAYKIDSAFQHTITGLCANTFYEVSFWMRNICSECGCDSVGRGANTTGYIPTAPGDSSGVYPNVTFDINGIDYYTSGNLRYTGQWVKKGFTYLTGPSETSIILKIMNNAPGGGGNDWALDDITVATCSPNFSFTPSPNPMICDSNVVNMSATISSFFSNYTHYKWQRSNNNGVTWFDTGVGSPPLATPVWNGTSFVYTVNYPPFVGYAADNGVRFRVIVSTTSGNLAIPNCQLTDGNTNITLNIIDCGEVLSTNIVSFTGQFQNGKSNLNWTTNMESMPYIFEIEKSFDGKNFTTIATTNSYGNLGANINTYTFTDPTTAQETAFYRIKMNGKEGFVKYSRIVKMILGDNNVTISSIVNPFNSQLDFYLNAPLNSNGEADLLDAFGRPVKKVKFTLAAGNNHITINGTQGLPSGAYTLRIKTENKAISKPVIKLNK